MNPYTTITNDRRFVSPALGVYVCPVIRIPFVIAGGDNSSFPLPLRKGSLILTDAFCVPARISISIFLPAARHFVFSASPFWPCASPRVACDPSDLSTLLVVTSTSGVPLLLRSRKRSIPLILRFRKPFPPPLIVFPQGQRAAWWFFTVRWMILHSQPLYIPFLCPPPFILCRRVHSPLFFTNSLLSFCAGFSFTCLRLISFFLSQNIFTVPKPPPARRDGVPVPELSPEDPNPTSPRPPSPTLGQIRHKSQRPLSGLSHSASPAQPPPPACAFYPPLVPADTYSSLIPALPGSKFVLCLYMAFAKI